jgi:hypothetical protein
VEEDAKQGIGDHENAPDREANSVGQPSNGIAKACIAFSPKTYSP